MFNKKPKVTREEREAKNKELREEEEKLRQLEEETNRLSGKNLKKREKIEIELLSSKKSIEVKPFETFKLHDLANMFPFNITPALIESKIAHAIAAKQRMFNSLTPQMAFLVIALLVGASIAGIILWKFMGAGTQEVKVTVDYAGGIIQAAAVNMTG